MRIQHSVFSLTLSSFLGTMTLVPGVAHGLTDCAADLPNHAAVQAALNAAVAQANGGFGLNMWATVVNRDGEVCAVAFSGGNRGDQWPGSRVISAQKANTANAFSLPGLALSTANLWAATQNGGSLFGLQFSNPVDTAVAYGDTAAAHGDTDGSDYGTSMDPMDGSIVGGVNVFGGGLALYDSSGTLLGAIGVSGDSSCADHNIAWRTRDTLGLDFVPAGVGTPGDNMIFDITGSHNNFASKSGFGHPECGVGASDADDNAAVVAVCPPGDGATPGCT
jgi:uncharacterized protein GlcG (DUF336 family)